MGSRKTLEPILLESAVNQATFSSLCAMLAIVKQAVTSIEATLFAEHQIVAGAERKLEYVAPSGGEVSFTTPEEDVKIEKLLSELGGEGQWKR